MAAAPKVENVIETMASSSSWWEGGPRFRSNDDGLRGGYPVAVVEQLDAVIVVQDNRLQIESVLMRIRFGITGL